MIVHQNTANVVTEGVQGAVSFGIKQEGLAHIFNVLRNQLYSDKILAVLREYSCNAVDSHVEAGKASRPIEVTLPNRMSPELKIRDFGLGLSPSDVSEVYAFYGESTKRSSNSLIGQLGLGSKSAFAYGDNFVINSFYDGVKTTYNAYIDVSQIGQIAKLASVPTTEENGVEIVIPVRPMDCDTFVSKAQKLFRYFKVKPIIHGVAEFSYPQDPVLNEGANWRVHGASNYRNDGSVAIMGNIGYKIDIAALKFDSQNADDESIRGICQSLSMELDFQIGDLDIAASREGLQYTERTINNIKKAVANVRDELLAVVNKELSGAKSLWAFKVMLAQINNMGNPFYYVSQALRNSGGFNYNGKLIKDTVVNATGIEGLMLYTPRRGYVHGQGRIIKGSKSEILNYGFHIRNNMVIVNNSRNLSNGITNYIFNYLKDEKDVIVCSFKDAAHKQAVYTALGLIDSDVVDMQTLPRTLLPRSIRSGGVGPTASRSKHTSKVFMLDQSFTGYHRVKSEHWTEADIDFDTIDKDSHAYVKVVRFKIGNSEGCPQAFNNCLVKLGALLTTLKTKGLSIPKVIGLKSDELIAEAKAAGVMDIKTFVEKMLTKLDAQTDISVKIHSLDLWHNFTRTNPSLMEMQRHLTQADAPNLMRLFNEINVCKVTSNDEAHIAAIREVVSNLEIKEDSIFKPNNALLNSIKDKMEKISEVLNLLRFVSSDRFHQWRNEHKEAKKAALAYISMFDGKLKGV